LGVTFAAIAGLYGMAEYKAIQCPTIQTCTTTRHFGISDEEARRAVALERRRIETAGSPPHSVSLIWGWGDT